MKRSALLLTIFLATSAHAQDDALAAAAKAYVEGPVQQKLMNDMLSPEAMLAQMGAIAGQLTPEQLELVTNIMVEEIATIRPQMEAAMIEGAIQTFTVEEITALNDFYNSDVGASAAAKIQPYMQATLGSMTPALRQMQGNISERIQAELSQ